MRPDMNLKIQEYYQGSQDLRGTKSHDNLRFPMTLYAFLFLYNAILPHNEVL